MKVYFPFFFIIICLKGLCQQKNEIGIDLQAASISRNFKQINGGASKTTPSKIIFSPGLSYQRHFSSNSCIEIGLIFRQVFSTATVLVPLGTNFSSQLNFSFKENFLSLPVLYKFNSKIIAVAGGPFVEYFLGSKQDKSIYGSSPRLGKDFFSDKWSLGFFTRLSKPIKMDKRLLLEPGLFYNPIFSSKRNYYGISIVTKYRL